MAKQPPSPVGRSKVRMFYVDADLASGEMEQLTEALRNAIRPTHLITRMAAPAQIPANGTPKSEPENDFDAESEPIETETETTSEASPPKPTKPRKYRSPKVVNELDMNAGGKSFSDFAAEKGNPTEATTRYLLAAFWLSEYAKMPTVSVDHIYTCYKSAGWTFDVIDPGLPFRYFKRNGLGDTESGKFTINHIGLSRVQKMGKSTED